jgi:hypothetical protein
MLDGGGHHFGSVLNGSFTAGGSKSGHMGSTGCSDFGSVLDGLWGSPNGNGFQMAKAGNDSISSGSGGVSADMFEFGSGHIGGICDGSFAAGSSQSCHVSSTSSGDFRGVLDGLWGSPDGNLGNQRREGGKDSISGGSCGECAVMFNFSGINFGSVCDRSLATSSSCGVSGKVSGTSSSNFVGVKSWEGRNDTVGSGGSSVGAVMFDFSGPDFGTVGN